MGGIMSAEILLWDYCGIGEIVVGLGGEEREETLHRQLFGFLERLA